MAFKDRLKQARLDKKLTQSDLAKKVGVTKSAIANYETGVSQAKNEVIIKICTVLEISPDILFQDEIASVDKIDRALKMAIDLGEIMKRRLYSDELALKEKTCAMVDKLDFDNTVKVYDYVNVIFENMNYKDKDQISLFDDDKNESQEDDSE